MRKMWPIVIALALAAPASAQSVKAGVEAWQRGDHARAVAVWRPLAEKGNADAAFNLGQAYRLGRGVPLNLGAAQTWLARAAAKGHVDAQATLGLLLFDSGNRAAGLRWLQSAAERGDARALLVLGTALFNGDGVARDPVRAYAFVSRAAAQGLAPARTTLAEMDRLMPLEQRQQAARLVPGPAAARPAAPSAASASKPAAAAPAAASGSWRVQLGAFARRESAEALFARLSAGGPLAGKQSYLVSAGAVTRLQAGPFPSRAAASAACAALSARGQACFPVAPG
ncbi:MAG TPA: SPOR domain-containing protein [Sphingomicrobium sp.]|nr:SPOR domain-containing protein [Sphingomicrobium sp.]